MIESRAELTIAKISQPYYRRLCRDLEEGLRSRKINRVRLEVVRYASSLPEAVPAGWVKVSQSQLDDAHELAAIILSRFTSKWLRYDDAGPPPRILPGSYGSTQ
jgi:hypothetical protein